MLGAPTAFLVLALPPLSRVASRTITHAEAMPRADEEGDARGESVLGGLGRGCSRSSCGKLYFA